MQKKILFTLCLVFLVYNVFSQKQEKIRGNKNVIIKSTNINTFNKLVVGEKFNIELIKGSEASVYVEADENLHDIIKFNVSDSTLNFFTQKKIISKKKLNIKVIYTSELKFIETLDNAEISTSTILDLEGLILKNTGKSRAYLNINSNKFKLINSQSAKVELNLNTKIATLELNENSTIEALINSEILQIDMFERSKANIEGQVGTFDITVDNSSDFKGKNLTTTDCNIKSTLNADAYIQTLETLTINASGNSEIYIYGNPKITIENFSENSKLIKKEL